MKKQPLDLQLAVVVSKSNPEIELKMTGNRQKSPPQNTQVLAVPAIDWTFSYS